MCEARVTRKGYSEAKPRVMVESFSDADMSDDDSTVPQRRSARLGVSTDVVHMPDDEDSSS